MQTNRCTPTWGRFVDNYIYGDVSKLVSGIGHSWTLALFYYIYHYSEVDLLLDFRLLPHCLKAKTHRLHPTLHTPVWLFLNVQAMTRRPLYGTPDLGDWVFMREYSMYQISRQHKHKPVHQWLLKQDWRFTHFFLAPTMAHYTTFIASDRFLVCIFPQSGSAILCYRVSLPVILLTIAA